MLKKILIALDGAERFAQLLDTLRNLHLQPDAKILLAHVISQSPDQLDVAASRPPADIEDLSLLYLDQLKTHQPQIPYNTEMEVVSGDPADEIIRLSHLHQVDLIIMGSRGLTGLNRVVQGSVSSQVVADAPCSVLVVKAA